MKLKELERQVADELAASFRHSPEDWRWADGDCDIVHGPNGVRMSASYYTIYGPVKVKFSFWNRRRIRRAFRRWKATTGKALAETDHHRALLALRRCVAQTLKRAA